MQRLGNRCSQGMQAGSATTYLRSQQCKAGLRAGGRTGAAGVRNRAPQRRRAPRAHARNMAEKILG